MVQIVNGEANPDDTDTASLATRIVGRMYPTTGSNGQRIPSTAAGIRNFWRWFNGVQQKRVDGKTGKNDRGNQGADNGVADSWTRDNQGRPRVFYHGTADDFSTFDLYHPNRKD
jgi:hypothetical protein